MVSNSFTLCNIVIHLVVIYLFAVLPRPAVKAPPQVSTERNFITAVRAMSEFLLKPSDLEDLRKTKRRSPFDNEPRITVYWRKDVENK